MQRLMAAAVWDTDGVRDDLRDYVTDITYYVVGLMGYAGKALKVAGLHVNTDLFTGASGPVAAALVWWMLRRVKARLHD
jgi:uncharacterized membrane-anchored protein